MSLIFLHCGHAGRCPEILIMAKCHLYLCGEGGALMSCRVLRSARAARRPEELLRSDVEQHFDVFSHAASEVPSVEN